MMPPIISFDSPELACYHEAGHAAVALKVGATVVEMKLYSAEPRSYGRTQVCRNDCQRRHIALGGFAAEYLLYKTGRLVKQDGCRPKEKEFIDYAIDNSNQDRISYFGEDLAQSDGQWPSDLDTEFMKYAIGWADKISLDVVEKIANALLASGELNTEALVKAVAAP
ncbi:hypothetical protein [Geminicoccus roseus]|uniref:hypothetical protein n=1 Tax=Geminicoccus roseus TaxID=404900 RepID=UPI0012F994C5|nr:hypothetical protein [Geminicoccus roseus]